MDNNKALGQQMQNVLDKLREELTSISTGRANISLIKDVLVEAYGTKTPLVQLASLSVPEPRTILIQPWDKEIIKTIEKAINLANINAIVSTNADSVKLSLSSLTQEKREDLIKLAQDKTEQARISLRNLREIEWKEAQKKEQDSEISEDEKFRLKDELQKLIDNYNKKLEELLNTKVRNIKGV